MDAQNILFMTTCAMTMIYQSIKEASYVFTHTDNLNSKHAEVSREAYAFIQGSGLDITIRKYSLDYSPNRIRDEFKRIFHIA